MSGCQIKVRVEGDMAMVQFINMDWAAKFRGSGGQQLEVFSQGFSNLFCFLSVSVFQD